MLRGKRLLVVEEEFLVAIDIQHILESGNVAKTTFARSTEEALALADQFADFDIAVVQVPDSSPTAEALVTRLDACGVSIVLTSFDATHRLGHPRHPGLATVIKPFIAEELLRACLQPQPVKDCES